FLCRALLQPLDELYAVDRASRRPHHGRRAAGTILPRRGAHADARRGAGNPEAPDRPRLRHRRHRWARRQRHHDCGAQFPAQGRHAARGRLCRREASGAVAPRPLIRFYGAPFGEPKDHPVTTAKAKVAPAAEKPASAAHPSLRALERPANLTGTNAPAFGSDVVADTLRALEIPYLALNPGASYRGLHDSIVNFLGN